MKSENPSYCLINIFNFESYRKQYYETIFVVNITT